MQADVDPRVKERLFGAEHTDGMLKQVAKARFLRELRQPTEGEDTDEQSGPSTQPRRDPLPIAPVRIGRFAILRKLGQGGMGVVYAAYDETLDRKVAIKVLRRGLADDERGRVRMLREAQALARLSHPNVVAVHEVGQWRDHDFVAMEFVSGRTLDAWLHERTAQRPWREVLGVLLQAGRGLAAAHARELVHRDFKPANVMVGDEGRVRVLDFGLARSVHERDDAAPVFELEQTLEHALVSQTASQTGSTSAFDHELTATGAVLGTPAYMAPEQHQGATATPLSDQFSFGVVLYEALYGERPFKGHSRAEYALHVCEGKIEVPNGVGVPAWLRKAVLRTLAPNPADRWPSMDALLAELGRERGRGFKIGALVAGFAALIVGGYVLSPSEPAMCELGDEVLAGVWDDEQRGALEQAFADEPHVHAVIAARLDRQAEALQAARRDACEARWVRQEQSDAQLALRNQCLDQRTRELRATVGLLAAGTAQTREHAVELLDGLGDVAFCDQIDLLEEGAPAPKDAATAEQIAGLRDRVADAHALRLASELPQAWAIVDAITPEVEQLGYGPLAAELAYLRGRLEQREERVADARVSLLSAATLAEEFGHLELAPAAWTYLVWVSPSSTAPMLSTEAQMAESAMRRGRVRPGDGRRAALEQALAHRLLAAGDAGQAVDKLDAALAILGSEPSIHRVSTLHLRGGALVELGRLDEARASYEDAWQTAAFLLEPDSLQCADIDFDLGVMLLEQDGSREDGRKRVEQSRRAYVRAGATARVAMTDLALANHALLVGDQDEALRLAERALEQLPEGSEDRGWALDAIAIIQLNRGDDVAAAPAVEAAIAHHARLGDSQSLETAFMVMQRGHLRLHQGRIDDAASDFDLAAAVYETTPDHHDWVALWTGRGEVALARGQAKTALDAFERAAGQLSPTEGDRRLVAHVAWGRARAMAAAGMRAEAMRHAETARDILTASGLEPELEAEIEAFLD
jgi:tetratricopeptide (TPR) repeat protein/tRNA A-37 threonylcarbamoyl transferase component Bud32